MADKKVTKWMFIQYLLILYEIGQMHEGMSLGN